MPEAVGGHRRPRLPRRARARARFKWQINFQVRGDLEQVGEQWTFTPDKMVGGFELPPGPLKRWTVNARKMRRMRKFGKAEMARRRSAAA